MTDTFRLELHKHSLTISAHNDDLRRVAQAAQTLGMTDLARQLVDLVLTLEQSFDGLCMAVGKKTEPVVIQIRGTVT